MVARSCRVGPKSSDSNSKGVSRPMWGCLLPGLAALPGRSLPREILETDEPALSPAKSPVAQAPGPSAVAAGFVTVPGDLPTIVWRPSGHAVRQCRAVSPHPASSPSPLLSHKLAAGSWGRGSMWLSSAGPPDQAEHHSWGPSLSPGPMATSLHLHDSAEHCRGKRLYTQ